MNMLNKRKYATNLQMFRLKQFNFLLFLVLRSDHVTIAVNLEKSLDPETAVTAGGG